MPRRMAFVYEFEADEFGIVPDIPTTVRRSKADCPQVNGGTLGADWMGLGQLIPRQPNYVGLAGSCPDSPGAPWLGNVVRAG